MADGGKYGVDRGGGHRDLVRQGKGVVKKERESAVYGGGNEKKGTGMRMGGEKVENNKKGGGEVVRGVTRRRASGIE